MMTRIRIGAALAAAALVLCAQSLTAQASTIVFSNMRAVFSIADDPHSENRIVSLLVNSALFGPGGFAGGRFQVVNEVVVPPDPIIWLADPFGLAPPADTTLAISFIVAPGGEVSGIQPTPFFPIFMAIPNGGAPSVFGGLDFTRAEASLGSLHLTGVVVIGFDDAGMPTGDTFPVDPFTIHAVPLPAALTLFIPGLAALGLIGWRRRRAERLAA